MHRRDLEAVGAQLLEVVDRDLRVIGAYAGPPLRQRVGVVDDVGGHRTGAGVEGARPRVPSHAHR